MILTLLYRVTQLLKNTNILFTLGIYLKLLAVETTYENFMKTCISDWRDYTNKWNVS